MEKRLISQVYKDKKEKAYQILTIVLNQIPAQGTVEWSIPCIHVDGRWNSARMNKLVTKLMDTKNKQKFLEMSEEDMIKEVKNYWQDKLMESYNAIDMLDVGEKLEKLKERGY